MFRDIVSPVQAWFLSQGRCVGCGKNLPTKQGEGLIQITCVCGRIYMYDPEVKKYRRASFHEVK